MRIEWSMLCRGCGELVATLGRLGDIDKDFFCYVCSRERRANLDEYVEIGFTVTPEIRSIRFHDPDSLTLDEYIFGYRFSRSILVKDDGSSLVDFIRAGTQALVQLSPGETKSWEATLDEGWVVGNPRVMISVEGEPTTEMQELVLIYGDRAFNPRPEVRPGPLRVVLENATDETLRVLQYYTPIVTYFEYVPFLTGQKLLNNATFRRVLRTGGHLLVVTPHWRYGAWSDPVYHVCEYSQTQLTRQLQWAADLTVNRAAHAGPYFGSSSTLRR